MKQRKTLTIPFALALDPHLSSAAKAVYLVLKSFQRGKLPPSTPSSIVIAHREIINASRLSHLTIVKALNNLAAGGWIEIQPNQGAANRYVFTDRK